MAKQHGVTAGTCTRFLIDSGAVYLNYGLGGQVLLGATRGGSSFKVETEIRIMEVDGAIGPVKGCRRITNSVATITANFVEFSLQLFLLANPGATSADYPDTPTKTHDQITRTADILAADYETNITIVGNTTQSATNYVICKLTDAMSDGVMELPFVDKEEGILPVTFTAHYDPTTLSTEPWEVRNPVIA